MQKRLLTASFALYLTASPLALATGAYDHSPQDMLIGVDQVVASANYGKGIVFGDIDTGIVTSPWFTSSSNGQGVNNIDKVNSGVCLNGTCTAGQYNTDGNSHGSFTASEIVGGMPGSGYNSVAPGGTVVAVQVLGSDGSGNGTDIANGIKYAVDHGAMVLNLSLGPGGGTGAQQAAFYISMANAVNYAAAHGVYVVFAGGNASQVLGGGSKITGFTDSAVQHLIFAGSTNASKQLSSFSNTPGKGSFYSTTKKTTATDAMWVMADGESIWGVSNSNSGSCAGYSCVQQDSGTSMAAPQVTGAIGLLLAKWSILKTNGDAALILEQTATDLGGKGIDTSYGDGFMNLVKAFQPVGTTTVTNAQGKSVAVSTLNKTMLTKGALGNFSTVSAQLSNYTVFDSFQRNFTMNMSGLLATKPTAPVLVQSIGAPSNVVSVSHFADGSSLAFGSADQSAALEHPGNAPSSTSNWFVSFTDASGSTVAAGNGFPASASFAEALWGNDTPVAGEVNALGVSNALVGLAEGGEFAAIGSRISKDTRMAFSWSETQADTGMGSDWTQPTANAFSAGLTTDMTQGWKAGVTFGMLNEQNGMLGTTYAYNGPLSFGNNNQSMSMGVSSAFALGGGTDLLLDAAITRTDGTALTQGLLSDISPIYARSYGAALVQRDAIDQGDNVTLSVKAPLKVYSGTASLATNSVDAGGNPIVGSQRVKLAPTGNEMDFTMGYQAPVRDSLSWNLSLEARHDADNIAGASDVSGLAGLKLTF